MCKYNSLTGCANSHHCGQLKHQIEQLAPQITHVTSHKLNFLPYTVSSSVLERQRATFINWTITATALLLMLHLVDAGIAF